MVRVALCVLLCVPWILSAATLVNINTASSETLESLPGIGAVYAERIIAYRSDTPFSTIEDIQNVQGIGPATFEKIQDLITVDEVSEEKEDKDDAPASETLHIDAPDVTFVNQKTIFDVSHHMSGSLVHYTWNFGDLSRDEGREVTHRFAYAGTYVVSVSGRHKGEDFSARHEITVLPVQFSITRSPEGDIQIHNDAAEEVDIGAFILSEVTAIVIPEGTTLLPYATLTVPREQIEAGGTYGIPRLYDAVGTLVATYTPIPETPTVVPLEAQPAAVVAAVPESRNTLAYAGLAAVLGIGIVGVYTRRREGDIEDLEKSI
jgi:competence ComEA-like helix-hairpin-helix protein